MGTEAHSRHKTMPNAQAYYARGFSAPRKKQAQQGCQDTHHDDTQHNDTQHNDTQHNDTQHNNTQHNDTQQYDTQQNDIRT